MSITWDAWSNPQSSSNVDFVTSAFQLASGSSTTYTTNDGQVTSEKRTDDTEAVEIETVVSKPASSTIDLTVFQDQTGDGSTDAFESVSVDDGTNTYSLSSFSSASGADYWLAWTISDDDGADTPIVDTATLTTVSSASISAGGGPTVSVTAPSASLTASTVPPSAPTLSVGTVTDTSVGLSWTDVDDENGYLVEYRESGGTFSQFSDVGAGTTTETVTGLDGNTDYEFRVGAYNSGGTSYSGTKSATTDTTSTSLSVGDAPTVSVSAPTATLSVTQVDPTADTDLTVQSREQSVTITVTDNTTAEEERRLQRSTDGGSTWTTVDTVGPDVTTLTDSNPPLYDPIQYRSQVSNDGNIATSDTITTVAVRPDVAYAELGAESSPTVIPPGEWVEIEITPEHTGLWRATLSVAPADRGALAYALEDCRLYYGDEQLFDGEIHTPGLDDGRADLQAFGKGRELQHDTTAVTYPDALGVDSALLAEAISDYWSRTPASATVQTPTPTAIRSGELFYDAPTPTAFTNFISVGDDVPVDLQATQIDHAPVRFFVEAENGSGSGTVIDTVDAPSDHSNFEAVELSAAGAKREMQFTPKHDIPWDEFVPRVRYEYEDFDGWIYFTVDDQRIGIDAVGGPATQAAEWGGAVDLGAAGTVNSPPADPLEAGTTYEFGVELSSDGNANFEGAVYVDCFAPGDSGDRFGGYSITEDNSVNTTNGTLTGPERYPAATDIGFAVDEDWRVADSTVDITITDTSNQQQIGQAAGGSTITAQNTTTQTVDWDSVFDYASTIDITLTLSRFTDDDLTSPASGDGGQSITGLEVTVTTDDTALVESANPLTLDADTHLENLQTLHEAGAYRFVVDHQADGLAVESFRKGDPAVAKGADWTLLANGASEDRDTVDYFNRINAVGDGVSRSILHEAEINRVGEQPVGRSYPNVTDADVLVDEMRRDLLSLVTNDERSGQLQIAPHLVLPGYPYDVPSFGGEQASLNGVSLRFGADVAQGRLEFGVRRTLGRRVARQDR
jgi:hypothetical protein